MTRLVLVRHGESNVTLRRVIGGPLTCDGLSPLGLQQSERLRDRWSATPELSADLVLASGYPRAIETAEVVAPALGGLSVVAAPGFGEHDPGPECDGLSYTEFIERYNPGPDLWQDDDPFATTFPGGETVAAFHYRVGAALRSVVDDHEGSTVVIFCHGGVIDAILRQALRAPSTGSFQVHTLNTSISELTLVKRNMWRLIRYNDAAHLAGLPLHTDLTPRD